MSWPLGVYSVKRRTKRLYYRTLEAIADLAAVIATRLYGIVERSYYR